MIPDCFLLLDVPQDVLVDRVTGRRTDPETGKIYHLTFNPPENEEIAARFSLTYSLTHSLTPSLIILYSC